MKPFKINPTNGVSVFKVLFIGTLLAFFLLTVNKGNAANTPQDGIVTPQPNVDVLVGAESSSVGVTKYTILGDKRDQRVIFEHKDPSLNGELQIRLLQDGRKSVVLDLSRQGRIILSITWHGRSLALRDRNGHYVYFAYDNDRQQWKSDMPNSEKILADNWQDLLLIGAINADVGPDISQPSEHIFQTSLAFDTGICLSGTTGSIPCSGSWKRGDAVERTKSFCCYRATNKANYKCWNSWCIGCCDFLSCDAACIIGDYFCVCGRSGKSCGQP